MLFKLSTLKFNFSNKPKNSALISPRQAISFFSSSPRSNSSMLFLNSASFPNLFVASRFNFILSLTLIRVDKSKTLMFLA